MTRLITIVAFFTFLTCVHSAEAASFTIEGIDEAVFVGDSIRVPVFIHPESEAISIVGADIHFPRELLWAKSFTFAGGWVPVSGEEFDVIDNGKGEIRKTAGFEDAFMERQLFGTIEFIAIKDGIAEMKPGNNSYIFDSKTENLFSKESKTFTIQISQRESAASAPPQLFDIRLEVERSALNDPGELSARVVFQSFGSAPTPVDMEFLIIDENGKILASVNDSIIVETESLFTKRFPELMLPVGIYTLHLNTRYAGSVVDDFRTDFRIVRPAQLWWALGGAAAALILGFATYRLFRFMRMR